VDKYRLFIVKGVLDEGFFGLGRSEVLEPVFWVLKNFIESVGYSGAAPERFLHCSLQLGELSGLELRAIDTESLVEVAEFLVIPFVVINGLCDLCASHSVYETCDSLLHMWEELVLNSCS